MAWRIDGPQGKEAQKIKYLLPRYTRGRGLDIGCGTEKAFPHFIGVDNGHHFGTDAADVVCEADDLSQFDDRSMDFVFSSHALEHLANPIKALREWGRVIKPGGYLCLYVPSGNLYPLCGEEGANPDHKFDIFPGDVEDMLEAVAIKDNSFGWLRLEAEERDQGDEYSLFYVFQKTLTSHGDVIVVPESARKFRGQTVCVCRFGGFGDMLQTASILARLKEKGYHVTVMTTPKGQDILKYDPYVDDFYVVDTDQVPNRELTAFWKAQALRYTHFINLSESIEGTLLAMPGRVNHDWPFEVRKKRLNLNYMDFTAELAGVEFKPCTLFYPSRDELDQAEAMFNTTGGGTFDIVWALAGSSCHKVYPHQDEVIARVMLEMPEAHVFFVGDDACRLLEQGWELEKRITMLSGEQTIRETLSMALTAHCVVGPETGVLNAVAYEKSVAKVVMLSHSSHNNLTKHWLKTTVVTPEECRCYPCHRLHYGHDNCEWVAELGASWCAVNTDPAKVYAGIRRAYDSWRASKNL